MIEAELKSQDVLMLQEGYDFEKPVKEAEGILQKESSEWDG